MGLAPADFDRIFQTFLVVEGTRLALADPEPAVPGFLRLPDVEDDVLLPVSFFLDAVVEALGLEALAWDEVEPLWDKELLVDVGPLLVRDFACDEECFSSSRSSPSGDLLAEEPDPLTLRSRPGSRILDRLSPLRDSLADRLHDMANLAACAPG